MNGSRGSISAEAAGGQARDVAAGERRSRPYQAARPARRPERRAAAIERGEASNRALLAQVSEHMLPAQRASLAAAVAQHQAQLGRMSERIQRLIADGADQRALVAEVAEHMPPARLKQLNATLQGQQAELGTVSAALQDQQAELGTLAATLQGQQAEVGTLSAALQGQQAGLGTLTAALQGQQVELGTLNATVQQQQSQLAAVNDLVRQLSSDAANQRALLTEVSQHLPPAQRANLEATLHGQQLQLGALNATMHANQIQLGALNDIVQRLSADDASQRALLAEISAQEPSARLASLETTIAEQQARLGALNDLVHQFGAVWQEKRALDEKITNLEHENRLLKVGHGATFDELAASGRVSSGAPYRFDDLLSLRETPQQSAPTVPPLVHIHVPKAAGTTVNNILMRSYKYRADSYGTDFFPRYFPTEFNSLVEPPPTADDRVRPMFFTGHIGVGNELFRRMPVRYIVITILRDPVSRIISHYRFNSTAPSVFQSAIQDDHLDVIQYFHRFRSAISLQYEYFLPSAGKGHEAKTVGVSEALRNLTQMVSIFGIQDSFDEFVVLLAELLGLPDVFYTPLNKTPDGAATVTRKQTEELRKLLADDIAFYDGAMKLYRQRRRR